MSNVIGFPSSNERGHAAIAGALDDFCASADGTDAERTAIWTMMYLGFEHTEASVRDRARRWLLEIRNITLLDDDKEDHQGGSYG